MSSIATVAAVMCVGAVACSFVSVAVPSGNTRRILNTVLGAFMLCCMIAPVSNALKSFSVNISVAPSSENLTATADEAYNNAVLSQTKANLESTLTAYLAENGCSVKGVEITLDVFDNGGIYISGISIYISTEDIEKRDKLIALTEDKFQETPRIIPG